MRFLDYRSKYGIAYVTSSNLLGVNFNDGTKLIGPLEKLESEKDKNLTFMMKDCKSASDGQKTSTYGCHASLLKKVTLFKYFKLHFE